MAALSTSIDDQAARARAALAAVVRGPSSWIHCHCPTTASSDTNQIAADVESATFRA